MKICLTCASGGHLDQLLCIIDVFKKYDIFFVTVLAETTSNLGDMARTYYVRNGPQPIKRNYLVHRFMLFLYYFYLIVPCVKILIKEKPDIILGCGGEATLNLSYLGKLGGARIIYIESLARIMDLSGTGKFVYKIADLFLVQWSTLLKKYGKAKYWGKVI